MTVAADEKIVYNLNNYTGSGFIDFTPCQDRLGEFNCLVESTGLVHILNQFRASQYLLATLYREVEGLLSRCFGRKEILYG